MALSNLLNIAGVIAILSSPVLSQTQKPAPTGTSPSSAPTAPSSFPSDYVIGVEDVLTVSFWRDKEMSGEAVVRPDGKISLPMLNDIQAAGLTPEALAATIAKAATKYVKDPAATVIVKEIRSRKIYVIGEVGKPGPFQLSAEMNVLKAIGEAGGFLEGAKKSDVVIVRNEGGTERRFKFNYNDVVKGKNLEQNILLLPGDTIIVR